MAQDSTLDPAIAIRCGEFVQAIYDSANPNEGPYLHLPLFGKGELFTMVHEPNLSCPNPDDPAGHPYGVSRYLYRTAEEKTVWGGYIAESSEKETQFLGRRDIVVALRGTVGREEGIADIETAMSDFSFVQTPASGASVHAGFLSVYTSIGPDATSFGAVSLRDQIFKELGRLIPGEGATSLPVCITVTGHSLGAALATLVACDVGSNFAAKLDNVTVCLITFASPKVGNAAFKTNTEQHTSFIWRYCSVADPVPSLPPTIPLLFPYVHVGTELLLDWTASPYVSLSWLPVTIAAHSLELHMHVLAVADGIGVYTSMEGLLPDLPPLEAAPTVDALIDWVSQLPGWEAQGRSRLRQKLEEVTQLLGDDEEALRQYLREVAYVGNQREPEAHAVGGDEDAPFGVRDYALLNKDGDLLKPEFSIPPNWLVHPNKDMVLDLFTMKWLPRVQRPSAIPTPSNPDYN